MTQTLPEVINQDCLIGLQKIDSGTIDVIVTSPPYNIGKKYKSYRDNRNDYEEWMQKVAQELRRVLHDDGSFFFNIGFTSKDPTLPFRLVQNFCKLFALQNQIIWVKSIAINDITYGHYKPLHSNCYLNQNFEYIFHFTKAGRTKINRLAIGVPYADKSNIKRFAHNQDRHCAGNVWFIPYETVQSNEQRYHHPAAFPVELPLRCIKLHGVRKGLVVLDPFAGIGTTLVAAKQLGVNAIGIEIDPHYAQICKERVASWSPETKSPSPK